MRIAQVCKECERHEEIVADVAVAICSNSKETSMDNNENTAIQQRIALERRVTRYVLKNNLEVSEILRGHRNSICSLSPAMANKIIPIRYEVSFRLKYIYSALSEKIHEVADERSELEGYISKFVPLKKMNRFVHLAIRDILSFDSVEELNEYLGENGWKFVSKQNFHKLRKACNKWREASRSLHYQMSNSEKQKIKKLETKHKNYDYDYYI